jgi:hypothetical protein
MSVEYGVIHDGSNIVTTALNSTTNYGVGGSGQFLAVAQSSTQNFVVVLGTSTTKFAGVLQNKPGANQAADVAIFGTTKVVAGSSIAAGDFLEKDANGRAITSASSAGSGAYVIGQAKEAAATAGVIIAMQIIPLGRPL